MSVFIRPDTKDGTYSYRFKLGGRPLSGNTGKTNKREAEKVETDKRAEAQALIDADKAMFEPELTFELACARWWNEVGQFRKDADRCTQNLKWLLEHFGTTTMLHDITPNRIQHAIAKRRGEPNRRTRKSVERISNTTVNRTMIEPLRQVVVRARDQWGVRVAKIKFGDLLFDEPQERVREASLEEERAILDRLDRGYQEAVDFSFKTGSRKMEVVGLRWAKVDWFAREGRGQFVLIGKFGKERTLPMTPYIRELLRRQLGKHPEYVFTFEARLTRRSQARGQHYPLTMEGYSSAVERAIEEAGVENFRIHDMRHTAATRMARSVNLKVVQRTLGHSDIKTTLRYAHVQQEDIAAGLEAAESCTKSYTKPADEAVND